MWELRTQPFESRIRTYDPGAGEPLAIADSIIMDPPFNERTHAAGARARSTEALPFAPLPDPVDLVLHLLERTRRWLIAFCALEQLGDYERAADLCGAWWRSGVWVKTNPAPQLMGDGPAQGCEGIAIMHRAREQGGARRRWNGGGLPATWHCAPARGEGRVHPTQKPIKLMAELVGLFSDPGETVWDPFAGAGTTGVAAVRLGRRFLGDELREEYAEHARRRLREAERQRRYLVVQP